ncbi:MAG: gluconate 2-dehydrogenase subunit 3 family protein [Bacteroidia bacterium]|nr:gluconate 2-dehydrogenase subunit 3 family protein [Bacteroidia bacterium]
MTWLTLLTEEGRKQEGHYFSLIKDLTLWGYFSSEVGCTQALRFNPIPGRFEGCIPYNNEPAWAG